MTKKDYQAIARVLYCAQRNVLEANTEHLSPRELATWAIGNVVSRIADVLASDNPRFDRARFIEACETGDMGKPKRIPLCARTMGCLCANHARGASVSALCDARE